jgi:hypothetical protein
LSKHTLEIPPADANNPAEAPYAETLIVDEGGIDLKVDGETIISASFEGLNPFQIAYEVLPEAFLFENGQDALDWEELVAVSANSEYMDDEDLELAARAFLTALARRNGYEK